MDTAALNRELCEKEGHVLGVVARPCLRCHEWFDPQYGRSPEPEDLRAEVERLRVERYLCVLAMRCAMGAHHDGVDAMRERLEPVVARYGIATACAARAAISDADAACIEAQYSRSEIAGSSGEPRDQHASGWVVEGAWSPTNQPDYWVGSSAWSTDPYKALRFATQQSALQAAEMMCSGVNIRICAHEWAEQPLTKVEKP